MRILIFLELLKIYYCMNINKLIGNTPLIKLSNKINPYHGINIYVKLEYYNPSGSIKDRLVKYIIDDGINKNIIKNDTVLIEASSGNTASSLALLSNNYGLKSIVCTTTKCSNEKINYIKSFKNTDLIIKNSKYKSSDSEYYQNIVLNMASENKNYYHLNQYNTMLNSECYYNTMGPEIWEQINGNVDYFVCSSGTGGTITGISKYLKEKNKTLKTILVDPPGSVLGYYLKYNKINKFNNNNTIIEGIGKDDIPKAINFEYIDNVININDIDAIKLCYKLLNNEGIFVGGSGGANVYGALKLAKELEKKIFKDKINIVTVIPDSGFKYISKIYNNDWLKNNNLFF